MTIATPDAMGVVFVVVWTALCFGAMAALSMRGL
ncbi:hypothetical protein AWB78_01321 [Caballeronia calidae]|uniref:Uncharacterized protein n=1 Tax=Caballeronia calidae TaxID=1777139 RepID=A0A158A6I6_9BURK|nr:hypothetical protein AWB78_01321 [Caballeronia calidae]